MTNMMRRVLSIYYKIPENLRDTIEKATKSFGLRGNNLFATGFGYAMGQAAKDPDTIFGHSEQSKREKHRRFSREMGGAEPHSQGCERSNESNSSHHHVHNHGEEPDGRG